MQSADERLIDRIYEAAAVPEKWPALLQHIADGVGAKGAALFTVSPGTFDWVASERMAADLEDYVALGWAAGDEHSAPLRAELYPGFRSETDYRSVEELERMPVHAEFLAPRGYVAGAGTILQGAGDDVLQLTFEGFPSWTAATSAVPMLDRLRPHFGRALGLASIVRRSRPSIMVETLSLAGIGAAVIDSAGRLRAANAGFAERMGSRLIERSSGLRFADAAIDTALLTILARARADGCAARSLSIPVKDAVASFALQIVPLVGRARDMAGSDGVLLLISEAANAGLPDPNLLRVLYDLTPAEALMARRIADGMTIAQAACAASIGVETARTHLRNVFAKTGVGRQAELVRLLLRGNAGAAN